MRKNILNIRKWLSKLIASSFRADKEMQEISLDDLLKKTKNKASREAYRACSQGVCKGDFKKAKQQEIDSEIDQVTGSLNDQIAFFDEEVAELDAKHTDIIENFEDYINTELRDTKNQWFRKIVKLQASLQALDTKVTQVKLEVNLLRLKTDDYEG